MSQFIASRRQGWLTLERLLARSADLSRLSAPELETLVRGYRQVTSDLAIARRDFPEDQITGALNALAAQAHLRLYQAPAGSWSRLLAFFTTAFARRVAAARGYIAAAAALVLLPALWAYLAAWQDAALRAALVPPQLLDLMAQGRTWTDIQAPLRPFMATVIFTNNIRVIFTAFAGGATLGLLTAYALVANGLMLGGVLGAAQHYGVVHLLLAFISAHGYLEMTMVVFAGAAGLRLGHAVLAPGLLRRRDALTRGAREAAELALGAAPVLVCAGLVEGLISPSDLPAGLKLALGPLLWLGFAAALWRWGRPTPART